MTAGRTYTIYLRDILDNSRLSGKSFQRSPGFLDTLLA
jgi:hypothetical protein